MNVYQDANGKWIFFDGEAKHRFVTEQEARSFAMATELSERPVEEEFAEKTIELIEDKAVATSMTAAAKHFIESGFENRLLSEKFVRVYNKFFLR